MCGGLNPCNHNKTIEIIVNLARQQDIILMEVPSFLPKSASEEIRYSQKIPEAVRSSFIKPRNSSENLKASFPLPSFIQRYSQSKQTCSLCEESYDLQEMDCLANCGHIFCISCLQRYSIYKINVMEDVTCPEQTCQTLINTEGTVFARLPVESKNKYKRMQLWKQTVSNPNLRLCPTENCEGMINISQYKCKLCHTQFCKQCQLPLHGGACDVNFQQNFKQLKRCPECHMFIEKTEGCNHVTCRCGSQFCYVCLAHWDESHYQCGVPNTNYINHNFVIELPYWKRIIFGLLMILGFPIFIALGIVCVIFCSACMAIGGFFCMPPEIFNSVCYGCCVCLIFYPVLMVVGTVLGLVYGLCFGFRALIQATGDYCAIIGELFSARGQQVYPDNHLII